MPLLAAVLCCLLTGRVETPSGRPLANAVIVVHGAHDTAARSNASGAFTARVTPGSYTLAASDNGYATTSVGPIEVHANEHIEIALQPLDTGQVRVIGSVTVNGRLAPVRNAIPTINVTRAQMQDAGLARVVDALSAIPSVTFARPDGGASSAFSAVALRGPDPSETIVALDGQILNDGNTGDIDLSRFPVAAFSNIAISEGLGPFDEEGSNTIGGAIDLISLQPTPTAHQTLSASLGSFGRSELWYNATGLERRLGYAFALDDQQETGYVDQNVVLNGARLHLGSSVAQRSALANLHYDFNERSDLALRIFTMGDTRDQSGVVNTPAVPSAQGPGDAFIGPGASNVAQDIRAYDLHGRLPLGAGSLIGAFSLSDDAIALAGGGISPYDVTHHDRRGTLSLSWERDFANSQLAFGGYLRHESLAASGVEGPPSQRIASYFARGGFQPTHRLHIEAGIYASRYSTFGSNLDGRVGGSYSLGDDSVARATVGTGFRAPLLIERYLFPVASLPQDANCVALGQGDPNEQPEHATEYEIGYSRQFGEVANLDVSLYRTNLRDPIENFYPLGAHCPAQNPPLTSYPINVGNAVYQGTEVRYGRRFDHLFVSARYGLNVAYPLDLPPSVSNPTSGGSLVNGEQFLNIPQQAGSIRLDWSNRAWHVTLAAYARGKNNELNQGAFAILDGAVGKRIGGLALTVAATNLTNAVAGRFTLLRLGVPYNGVAGALPTNAYYIEPLGIRFIVTAAR